MDKSRYGNCFEQDLVTSGDGRCKRLLSKLTSSANGSTSYALMQSKAADFKTVKSRLGGAPIALRFGGYDWTVVYATTNTTKDMTSDSTTKGGRFEEPSAHDNFYDRP